MDKKPKEGLAVIIARMKAKKGMAPPAGGPEPEAADKEESPLEHCMRLMFEAGSDGDYSAAAKAFSTALDHADKDDGDEAEREEAEGSEEY